MASAEPSDGPIPDFNLWRYLHEEMFYSTDPSDQQRERKERELYNFFHIPMELERLLLFGWFVCLDSLLFVFTFMPLRVAFAFARMAYCLVTHRKIIPRSIYDVLRGAILVVSVWCLSWLDTSMIYHYIRGQALFKLYVIFNVLEIFDKLCAAFGQDLFDTLFWRASYSIQRTRRQSYPRIGPLFHALATLVYVVIHSTVLFHLMLALNVALNSHTNVLITLLVSNQFIELKTSVFKRYIQINMFQLSCSDIVERFQLVVFLVAITVHNLADLSWSPTEQWVTTSLGLMALVLGSECLVDWIKHAFITKFNNLSREQYRRFKTLLCLDVVDRSKKKGSIDPHYEVSRRIGFVPLPLAVVIIRVFTKMFVNLTTLLGMGRTLMLLGFSWLLLVVVKVVTTRVLYAVGLRGWHLLRKADGENLRADLLTLGDVYRWSSSGNLRARQT